MGHQRAAGMHGRWPRIGIAFRDVPRVLPLVAHGPSLARTDRLTAPSSRLCACNDRWDDPRISTTTDAAAELERLDRGRASRAPTSLTHRPPSSGPSVSAV